MGESLTTVLKGRGWSWEVLIGRVRSWGGGGGGGWFWGGVGFG